MSYTYQGNNFGRGQQPYRCGTDRAYQAHKRNGEEVDEACYQAHLAARRQWHAERMAQRPKKEPRPPRPPRVKARRGNAPIPNLYDVWSAHAANA